MKSSKLAEDGSTRAVILSALAEIPEESTGLSAAELASLAGVHVTTVRFHIDRLTRAGAVRSRVDADHAVGRPGRRYWLTTDQHVTRGPDDDHFKLLAGLLSESFRRSPEGEQPSPEQVGERWAAQHVPAILGLDDGDRTPARTPGEWLGKVGMLVDLLLAWGYDPVLSTEDGGTSALLRLRDCPFLELARADQEVICGTHLGLVRGALRDLGETDGDVQLEPFSDPPLCLVRLARHHATEHGSHA
ncbi:MAG TPA: helix-turn-helix domain-containing protein [Nocardioidaceae bacterium]|nr:helix-turn-helix domain-containing protein [Nocardioidaceae bacterium]